MDAVFPNGALGLLTIGCEIVEESDHPGVDLVPDASNGLKVLLGRVVQLPVLVAFSRVDRAGISAAHGDHDIGGFDELVAERLGKLLADIDPDLLHRLDHAGVEPVGWGATG
jgi:hypothetical protein